MKNAATFSKNSIVQNIFKKQQKHKMKSVRQNTKSNSSNIKNQLRQALIVNKRPSPKSGKNEY